MPDSLYDEQVAAYRKQYENQLADIGYQRQRTQQEYGFEDATDPFSRARMLERAYKQRQASITGGMASQGQLYSGAYQGAQEEASFTNAQQTAAARQEYLDRLYALSQRGVGAGEAYTQGELSARQQALQRAIDQGPGPPEQTPQQQAAAAGWTPQQAAGGPSPGPGYQWNQAAFKWVKTGPSPGKNYKWNFAKNRWEKK